LRRKIAILLSILMLVTLLVPVQGFAAEEDQGLEKAIKAVKSKIDIPDSYKFTSSYSMENGIKVWRLNWDSGDELEGSISVRVNEKGTILSYNQYKPYNYQTGKFPKVSRQQAKENAESFINRVNPGLLESLMYIENYNPSILEYAYYLEYVRLVNGIPYYDNNVNVRVDSDTGEVIRYYYNWSDDLDFPDPKGKIELTDAQKAYMENMGLKLVYMSALDNEKLNIFAAYVPKYDNYSYAIDAFTGERFKLNERYDTYYAFADEVSAEKQALRKAAGDMGSGGITITPEEQKEIEKIMKLKSLEEVEKIARGIDILGLTTDMKLTYYSLSQNWTEKDRYSYYLNFSNEASAKDRNVNYTNVTIDAVTGKVTSFYSYSTSREDKKPVDDAKAARAAVEKFLKEFAPDEFSQTEFDEEGWKIYLRNIGTEPISDYNFYFTRKVNGIPCQNNGISVSYDAVNQKVYAYSLEWLDEEFPPIEGTAKPEDVYKVVFGQVGLELQYKPTYPAVRDEEKVAGNDDTKPVVKLVYVLKNDKPLIFDGFTGAVLDYSGKLYKEVKPVEYTDIDNSYAKNQIMALAEYGIYLDGAEFRPNDIITQLDFFVLLSKTMGYYSSSPITNDSAKEEIDDLYNYLIREGVITKEEKKPDSTVRREDAVKYIINAMKYGEVAKLKGIFNCTFSDKDNITPELVGYVTIAQGFKIVSGDNGKFNPQAELSRADAAIMIYNYLQR